jgi:ribosomal protein S18 acetylase RimI-like enzyme
LEILLGPKGFLRSSGMGILIDGFEYLPSLGIPYNLPYYQALFEDYGFRKKLDQFSYYMDASFHFPPKMFEAAEKVKQRGNFWIKIFNHNEEMRKWIPQVKQVQEIAFTDNPNYYPSTDEEFNLIANNLIQIAVPGLIRLIMKGDDVAGFVLGYPDISRALQKTRGRLFPFGWFTILREKKRTRVVDYNGIGLLPQYQGLGSNILLYVEIERSLRKSHYESVDFAQVNEDNYLSMSEWENLGARRYKTHRTYEMSL